MGVDLSSIFALWLIVKVQVCLIVMIILSSGIKITCMYHMCAYHEQGKEEEKTAEPANPDGVRVLALTFAPIAHDIPITSAFKLVSEVEVWEMRQMPPLLHATRGINKHYVRT